MNIPDKPDDFQPRNTSSGPPQTHYNPDTGDWDGQLPNPGIASEVAPPTGQGPAPSSPAPMRLYDSPEVARYCRETGPELGFTARTVFCEIGRHIDPQTGQGRVLMETLAATLECGKATVFRAVRTLECAGQVEVEKVPTQNGRLMNVYHLDLGLHRGWVPAYKPPRAQLSLMDQRLKLMTEKDKRIAELERMVASLNDGVIPDTPDDPAGIVPSERNSEEEKKEVPISSFENGSSSFPSPVPQPGIVPSEQNNDFSMDEPPEEFDEGYVKWAVPQFPKWRDAWNGWPEAALATYRSNWPKFLEDLKRHRDQSADGITALGPDQIRCATCNEVKPKYDSFKGNCGRCKHAVEHRSHQVQDSG